MLARFRWNAIIFTYSQDVKNPEELTYYLCHAADDMTFSDLICTVGQRWHNKSRFEQGREEVGHDELKVRSWPRPVAANAYK